MRFPSFTTSYSGCPAFSHTSSRSLAKRNVIAVIEGAASVGALEPEGQGPSGDLAFTVEACQMRQPALRDPPACGRQAPASNRAGKRFVLLTLRQISGAVYVLDYRTSCVAVTGH